MRGIDSIVPLCGIAVIEFTIQKGLFPIGIILLWYKIIIVSMVRVMNLFFKESKGTVDIA